jgi:type I restriction enzyme S subunit
MKLKIRDFSNVTSGSTPSRSKHKEYFEGGTIPWVKTMDLTNGPIKTTAEKITPLAAKSCKPYAAGTVLVAMYGGFKQIGRTGLLVHEAAINQALSAIQVDPKKCLPEYLIHYLNHNVVQWRRFAASSRKDPNITSADVRSFQVEIPSLSEQMAIADLLSAWDEVIERTERLIRMKEKHFANLIKQLIYQPVKDGKWAKQRAGKLFQERRENNRSDLPLLAITNDQGVIPRDDTNRKDTSNGDKSKYLRICPGDLGYNTMRMWQGVSALSALEGIVSPAYTICIPGDKLVPEFVAFLFKSPFMIHRFYRYSQGLTSDTWNLKYKHFSEVDIPLPCLDEQQQIAQVLSDAQQEIHLLKKLTARYKEQQRGLMQKLLTGEWRVNVDKEVA